jgi:glucosamine-6-phosphate deaminase
MHGFAEHLRTEGRRPMDVKIMPDKQQMGKAAAAAGARLLRDALAARGAANIIVATGASQFEMLAQLAQEPDINWHRVTGFHLDEYVGLPIDHPASFRGYLWQRFVSRLPLPLRAFHYLDGEGDPRAECRRVADIIRSHPIDVAFVGIGENGHLAFNDPPADFEADEPYLVVQLDEACRRQQLGEGWFPTFEDVPKQAISMSVRQIMKSRAIICTVPDERKAQSVRNAVEGDVTPKVPASILQRHERCTLFLDKPAASLLRKSHA